MAMLSLYSVGKFWKMRKSSIEFDLSAQVYVLGALMVLILPYELLLSALTAATIHECFHLLALWLCKAPIHNIRITAFGAEIKTANLTLMQELLCAAAGPAGSLLCLLLIHKLPLISLCGATQGFYNLLPIYPLDGGRILRCAVMLLLPKYADWICHIVMWGTILCIDAGCTVLFLKTKQAIFLYLTVYFLLKLLPGRKTPCKDGRHWVQ